VAFHRASDGAAPRPLFWSTTRMPTAKRSITERFVQFGNNLSLMRRNLTSILHQIGKLCYTLGSEGEREFDPPFRNSRRGAWRFRQVDRSPSEMPVWVLRKKRNPSYRAGN